MVKWILRYILDTINASLKFEQDKNLSQLWDMWVMTLQVIG